MRWPGSRRAVICAMGLSLCLPETGARGQERADSPQEEAGRDTPADAAAPSSAGQEKDFELDLQHGLDQEDAGQVIKELKAPGQRRVGDPQENGRERKIRLPTPATTDDEPYPPPPTDDYLYPLRNREASEEPGFALPHSALRAADDDLLEDFTFQLDENMVSSPAVHKQEIGRSPSAVTVITREDIATSGATSIGDLLRLVPGLDIVTTSPFFTSIATRLHWNGGNKNLLVLIDGREANFELLGATLFEIQPVFLDDIERIEVIRGPGSFLYGANALTGVVNITTESPMQHDRGKIVVSLGEGGVTILNGRIGRHTDSWGVSLSGGADLAGYSDDGQGAGKKVWRARTMLEYRVLSSSRLLLEAGLSRSKGVVQTNIGMLDTDLDLGTVRLAYESERLKTNLVWSHVPARVSIDTPVRANGLTLATIHPVVSGYDTLEGELRWNLPQIWSPLLAIIGATTTNYWLSSADLLDEKTFSDPTSDRYHQAGIDWQESRFGAFLHAEFSSRDWYTVTGDVRFDYNTVTQGFVSPRLASVFSPAPGQFFRVEIARSFRKPSFEEVGLHVMADIPKDSPILWLYTEDQVQEFLSRSVGNPRVENEKLLSVESGYVGQFLENRLFLNLDVYYNMLTDYVGITDQVVNNALGVLDLDQSHIAFTNRAVMDRDVLGVELGVRFKPSPTSQVLASWTHREITRTGFAVEYKSTPSDLASLGGRFRTERGWIGSLYGFYRARFPDAGVQNPDGLIGPQLRMDYGPELLLMGRLGWKLSLSQHVETEVGIKITMPISPLEEPHFAYREKGGGIDVTGNEYGGALLCRRMLVYLQGSF